MVYFLITVIKMHKLCYRATFPPLDVDFKLKIIAKSSEQGATFANYIKRERKVRNEGVFSGKTMVVIWG